MIEISDEIRALYKTDRYPLREVLPGKEMFIKVLETGTIIGEGSLESENFTLEESICTETDVTFGSCEASKVSFAVLDINEDLIGKTIKIWQEVEGVPVPFGTYRINAVTKRDADPRWKDITACDRMTELDKDVTAWFEEFWSGKAKATLKEFRLSFFKHMKFDLVDQELPNDHMEIEKTIDPEYVKGRYIAQQIGEINACFGHFTRDNKFTYKSIGALALYPSETLYPAEDLFPAESTEMLAGDNAIYFARESHYEDYYVRAIDSVQFKESDGSAGITVGETQENTYVVQGNFLLYNKPESELREIGEHFLALVKRKFYIPNTTKMIGLPYLEVGDTIAIVLEQDAVESFIFQRRLTGIQALKDEIIATGNETRRNDTDENTQLIQLKAKIENVVEETDGKIEGAVEDLTGKIDSDIADTNLKIDKTNDSLLVEISRAKGEEAKLSSQISMTVNEIKLYVGETYESKTDAGSKYAQLYSEIQLTSESITSTVAKTYETKSGANSRYESLSSQITQTANSITSTVSATYETKNNASSNYTSLSSQITQTANSISQKVSRGDVVSEINQSADTIWLSAGRLLITTGNFTLDSYGNIGAYGGNIGDFTISGGALVGSGVEINYSQIYCNDISAKSGNQVMIGGRLYVTEDVIMPAVYGNTISGSANVGITSTGYLGHVSGSSRKWKHDIGDIKDSSIDPHRLYNARPREFIYNDGYLHPDDCRAGKKIPGFIIEELMEDYPIAVDYDEHGNPTSWSDSLLTAPMLSLIQEQYGKICEMEDRLEKLENKMEGLSYAARI